VGGGWPQLASPVPRVGFDCLRRLPLPGRLPCTEAPNDVLMSLSMLQVSDSALIESLRSCMGDGGWGRRSTNSERIR
jgi:hypothetical protein